jgi:hypothetical protein
MSAKGELNWEEIEELVKGSYALISSAKAAKPKAAKPKPAPKTKRAK